MKQKNVITVDCQLLLRWKICVCNLNLLFLASWHLSLHAWLHRVEQRIGLALEEFKTYNSSIPQSEMLLYSW